jgi:hypothetical protein
MRALHGAGSRIAVDAAVEAELPAELVTRPGLNRFRYLEVRLQMLAHGDTSGRADGFDPPLHKIANHDNSIGELWLPSSFTAYLPGRPHPEPSNSHQPELVKPQQMRYKSNEFLYDA